jgi:hypothetical protein
MGFAIMELPSELRDDKEFILLVQNTLKLGVKYYEHLSDRLKNDYDIAFAFLDNNGVIEFNHLSKTLRMDKTFIVMAMERYPTRMHIINGAMSSKISIFDDKERVKKLIHIDPETVLSKLDEKIATDKDFILELVKMNYMYLKFLTAKMNTEYMYDKEFAIELLKISPYIFLFLPKTTMDNPEVRNFYNREMSNVKSGPKKYDSTKYFGKPITDKSIPFGKSKNTTNQDNSVYKSEENNKFENKFEMFRESGKGMDNRKKTKIIESYDDAVKYMDKDPKNYESLSEKLRGKVHFAWLYM